MGERIELERVSLRHILGCASRRGDGKVAEKLVLSGRNIRDSAPFGGAGGAVSISGRDSRGGNFGLGRAVSC